VAPPLKTRYLVVYQLRSEPLGTCLFSSHIQVVPVKISCKVIQNLMSIITFARQQETRVVYMHAARDRPIEQIRGKVRGFGRKHAKNPLIF
jgi:hypothetical protein